LSDILGDFLSPPRCAACDAGVPRRQVFCAPCAASVETCSAPSDGVPADDVPLAFGYYGGALAQAIRRLKYDDRPDLARPLGELLRSACRAAKLRADVVVPVPLHPRRLVERGYNQCALLAARVATEIEAPLVASALTRIVDTQPQAALPRDGRRTNVASVFGLRAQGSVEGRMVAVVDDVSTTGSTLDACCRALLFAGARGVVKIVLARTPPSALGIPLGLDRSAVPDVGACGPERVQDALTCRYALTFAPEVTVGRQRR
jgi:ComF family protein